MNRDYIRQIQMIELREFTGKLLSRVEELREETNKYGGVRSKNMDKFFKDIEELKDDFRIRNQITPEKHMARLNHLSRVAEEKELLGAAVNAEVHRGKMAGYYVEKKLIGNASLEDLTEDQIDERLKKIEEQYDLITTHEDKDAE